MTNQMPQHSPTPWTSYECQYGSSQKEPPYEIQIRDASGDIVAVTSRYGQHAGAPLGKQREANVALVLRAVNSHERLVGATRDLLEAVGCRHPITGEWFCEFAPAFTPTVRAAAEALYEVEEEIA